MKLKIDQMISFQLLAALYRRSLLSCLCFLLVLLYGCTSEPEQDLVGTYTSHAPKPKLYQRVLFYNSILYNTIDTLELKADSSYVHTNCNKTEWGSWYTADDSLHLLCDSSISLGATEKKYMNKSDSLWCIAPFKIEKNSLYHQVKGWDTEGKNYVLRTRFKPI